MTVSNAARDNCQLYIGRTRTVVDSMSPEPAARLATLLEVAPLDRLPTTWHWAYFNQAIAPGDVGYDGHERLGVFLPPVPYDRRMWAGGTVEVLRPLAFNQTATKTSRIADVVFKTGKSGDMCFVTVAHDIAQGDLAIRETQTLVYRDRGSPVVPQSKQSDVAPDDYESVSDTTLVAYSAITQNGHRIHWDRDFCRHVEGYPDLVVHGPWLATRLADALQPQPGPCCFQYRATAPVFVSSPFRIVKNHGTASVERSDGVTAMRADLA